MFSDIIYSDLQIVALCEYNINRCNVKEFQFIRKINEDTMASFPNELGQRTWEDDLKLMIIIKHMILFYAHTQKSPPKCYKSFIVLTFGEKYKTYNNNKKVHIY